MELSHAASSRCTLFGQSCCRGRCQLSCVTRPIVHRQLLQHEIAELHYILSSFIPTLTNSNCTLLNLVNAGKITYSGRSGEFKCRFISAQGTLIPVFLPPKISHFLEPRFKVAPTAISILMVCSIGGNTPSALPFAAVELWSRGVCTIKMAQLYMPLKKSFAC